MSGTSHAKYLHEYFMHCSNNVKQRLEIHVGLTRRCIERRGENYSMRIVAIASSHRLNLKRFTNKPLKIIKCNLYKTSTLLN